jgi:tRNA modification GTPase
MPGGLQNNGKVAALPLSAGGGGGISVIYALGTGAHEAVCKSFNPRTPLRGIPERGRFYLGYLSSGKDGDEALVRFMDAGESPYAVESVEINTHGGEAAVETVLEILKRGGAGIISRGAALLDAVRRGALHPVAAEARWLLPSAETKTAAAMLIAQEKLLPPVFDALAAGGKTDIGGLLEKGRRASACTRPRRVLIAGRPNAGKSSLMNAILKSDRVLVDAAPGTTRDLVEETAVLDDVAIVLMDSAGIRPDARGVEKIGVARAEIEKSHADLVLYIADRSLEFNSEDRSNIAGLDDLRTILVLSKSDLPGRLDAGKFGGRAQCVVSAKTGEGLGELSVRMADALFGSCGGDSIVNEPAPFSDRHIEILKSAVPDRPEILKNLVSIERIGEYHGWET